MGAALEEATAFGCETLQMFSRAPRLWRSARLTDAEASAFKARRKELGLFPLVVHTPFLPNLSTRDALVAERTRRALAEDLKICERVDADYLVIHPGAYSVGADTADGIHRMMEAVNEALTQFPKTTLLVENMAGGGRRVGSRWEELAAMVEQSKYPDRFGVCLDTAHTYGAGHPFATPQEVGATLESFDRVVGLGKIKVIHVNDSGADLGSHLDIHENLGKGAISLEAFRKLFAHPKLSHAALILETPRDYEEDDRRNLDILRGLLK